MLSDAWGQTAPTALLSDAWGQMALLSNVDDLPPPPLPAPDFSRGSPEFQGARHDSADIGSEFQVLQGSPDFQDIQRDSKERTSNTLMQEVTLRWLAMVFIVTVLLLAFQVIAGMCSGSLTLIADSAHSLVDVISYGLNYFVERVKVRSEVGGHGLMESSSLVAKVDFCGGATSTVALLVATGFAVSEAIARLRGETADESEDEFSSIGPVLLAFAVVSTLANVGILATFIRWQAAARSTNIEDLELGPRLRPSNLPEPLPELPEPVSSPPPPSVLRRPPTARPALPGAAHPLPPIPSLRPIVLESAPLVPPPQADMSGTPGALRPSRRSARQLPRRQSPRPSLNLCSDFSSAESGCGSDCSLDGCGAGLCVAPGFSGGPEGTENGEAQTALKPSCRNPRSCASSSCCGTGSADDQRSWYSMLHMLVHPGCTDSAHASEGGDPNLDGQGTQSGGNLNLSAAMLHLVADVVRGITILISAIIIQAGVASDAGKVDAVCALLVAVFIFIGAIAIFQRLANSVSLIICCRGRSGLW